jgi:hypothetical protein
VTASIIAAIVIPLRLLLRRWRSLWPKTFAVHAAATVAVFLLIVPITRYFPPLQYVGLLTGTLICFCVTAMLADGTRAWQRERLIDPATGWRISPWNCLVAIGLAGAAAARFTLPATERIADFDKARWGSSIIHAMEARSPDREILPALWRDFPDDADRILTRYSAAIQSRGLNSRGKWVLPAFPFADLRRLITSKRSDIARAPDRQLMAINAYFPWFADLLTTMPKSCASIAAGGDSVEEPGTDVAAPEADRIRVGQMYAAVLDAARAGIDHPVDRMLSPARRASLEGEFRRTLPARLQPIAETATGQDQCAILLARYRWIARLYPESAAAALAVSYADTSAPRLKQ